MQITEKSVDGLVRVYEVVFSADFLNAEVDKRIHKLSKEVKMSGFRVGSVPVDVVRRHYYDSALSQQLQSSIRSSVDEVVKKFNLTYALTPKVEPEYNEQDGVLTVTVSIDTLPEVVVPDCSKLKVKTYNINVSEEDIKQPLDELKKRYPNWVDSKEGRVIAVGDMVEFSCVVTSHRKGDKPQKYNDAKAIIGQKTYGSEFDENVCGTKVGERVKFVAKLPKGHKFAGTKMDYDVFIKSVKLRSEFETIDDLAKALQKTVAELKDAIIQDVSQYYKDMSWLAVKRQILDFLSSKCDFEVSSEMVNSEFENIWNEAKTENAQSGKELSLAEEEKSKKEYMDIALRRVRLGFVLAEIGKVDKISVQAQEIKESIEKTVSSYGVNANDMYKYYMSNRGALESVRATIFEDKVIKHILSKSQTEEISITPQEVLKLVEDDDATTESK